MSDSPLDLSVIIPCLNEAGTIEGLLADLQGARGMRGEVIVVDGGSEDGTLERIDGLADKVVSARKGRANQMNAGAGVAGGTWLWFLHADSGVNATLYQSLFRLASEGTSGWGRFDVTLSGNQPLFRVIETMMNVRSRITGIATGDQGIFIRKDLFELQGGFPDIPLMEDIEMSRRLKRMSNPVCLHNRLLTSSRRWEERGVFKTIWLMWRLRWAYYFGASPQLLADQYR